MKTLHRIVGGTFVGLLSCGFLNGCAHSQVGTAFMERRIGPTVFGGVTYYPAKSGATYYTTPLDYTTNPPPARSADYVTVISSNGIAIHLIDAKTQTSTETLPK
jgi:hypothetical protein